MGDIIVGDWDKLKLVGENANCDTAGCPPEWALPDPELRRSFTTVSKSTEAQFYDSYMRVAFPSYRLAPRSGFRDPRNAYRCGFDGVYVFEDEPYNGFADSYEQYVGQFDVYALANTQNLGPFVSKPNTPPESALTRMFSPVSNSLDPTKGGLGFYPPDYFRDANAGHGTFLDAPKANYHFCDWHQR